MEQPAQVMPMCKVASVDATRDFYVDKLGFDHLMAVVGHDGQLDFCTVIREGGRLMFTRADSGELPPPSAEFYFQVSDVESYREEVSQTGIEVSMPEDMWWGDRVFILEDVNGYKLWFYQSMRAPEPPEGLKIV